MSNIVGRKKEIKSINDALGSTKPELIVLYGRRRIGKTFLVRELCKNNMVFEFSGIYNVSYKNNLNNFYLNLKKKYPQTEKSSNWIEAFHQLSEYLETLKKTRKKKVIFIDEFPWLDTRKSNFLQAFDNFWNSYATKRNDLLVISCGSAASYMVKKIIKSKGGLHNRLTKIIPLSPFNLWETSDLLKRNNVNLTHYDILLIYMAIGGVPFYLNQIEPGKSVAQVIDELCFQNNGFLRDEFNNIFASLFDQHANHEKIVRTLSTIRKGNTRNQISKKTKIKTGGRLSEALEELEISGFIEKYLPYDGNKDPLFRLSDEYSLFYLKFIENSNNSSSWQNLQSSQSYKIWSGFTFESICIKHVKQIKQGLSILGIESRVGNWIEKNNDGGAQIDIVIDRNDNSINLCELKFYSTVFSIDKKYSLEISNKVELFKKSTKTRKTLFTTFITTFGLADNAYKTQVVQNELTIDNLFVDL